MGIFAAHARISPIIESSSKSSSSDLFLALVSLTGLENLQQTSVFKLIHHESLSSLSKLESIQTINTRLTIINNSILPTCEAEALRDHIGAENILRGTFISENDDLAVCE